MSLSGGRTEAEREGRTMKVLVTGVAGQLGHDVTELLKNRDIPCRGVDLADFDLTDGAAVKACAGLCADRDRALRRVHQCGPGGV